jgi:hypothetical protein
MNLSLAYELLADYPTRPGKGIRPLLCLAAAHLCMIDL